MRHIDGVDLNLIKPLAALLAERNVSRAADRAGMTQSAMSRALGRLRVAFDDELLIRSPGDYELTPRAERLRRQLTDLTPQLEAFWAPGSFEPAQAAERFRIACGESPISVLIPQLFTRLHEESPLSSLRVDPWHDRTLDDVEHGAIDLVFYGAGVGHALRREKLFDERFVCVVDTDHPLAHAGVVTLESYGEHSHFAVNVASGWQPAIDGKLELLGSPRRIALSLPTHAAAAQAIVGTTLIATLPLRLSTALTDEPRVRLLPAPPEIATMRYVMAWHPRNDADPAHVWLRELVRATMGSLEPPAADETHGPR